MRAPGSWGVDEIWIFVGLWVTISFATDQFTTEEDKQKWRPGIALPVTQRQPVFKPIT